MGVAVSPALAAPPGVSAGEFLVDIVVGTVLFVLVIIVVAILMVILQAVLPGSPDRRAVDGEDGVPDDEPVTGEAVAGEPVRGEPVTGEPGPIGEPPPSSGGEARPAPRVEGSPSA